MTAPRAGRAAVEIVGDVGNFGAQIERDLNGQIKSVNIDTRGMAKDMADGIDEGTETAKRSLSRLGGHARGVFTRMGRDAGAAGVKIREGLGKGTEQPRDELGRFVKRGAAAGGGFALGFGGVTKVLGGIGKLAGSAFGIGLKGAALASAANTAMGLVVALGPAVGAVGALAPAFIAAKIAAGTFKLAMMGVSDAVSAGLTGDTEAFNEALKEMPVTAQNAMKEIVSLKEDILAVRQVVQGNFFGSLQGQIAPLGKLYLPMVANQLGVISSGFGDAAASASQFLQMPESVARVNNSLTHTGEAVNNVTAGVPGLIRAFLPLWEVGSSFLPGLTAEFDGLTQRIGAFMERAQETGQLHTFISNGLSVLGELGQILGDVGSILASVFQAASAAGGDLLGVIGGALSQFAAFLNTAQGMEALTAIFEVLAGVGGLLGQALAVVLPIVGQLVSVLGAALKPLLPVISGLIQQLAPVVAQVGEALGAILGPAITMVVSLLKTLIPVIMPIVQALMGALMPVVQSLAPVITQLGAVLGTILGAALKALMPIFDALLPVISELLVSVLTPLVPVLGQVGELFLALMPAIVPLVELIVALLNVALRPLIQFMPYIAAFSQLMISAITAIVGPIAQAIGWVAKLLQKLLTTGAVKDAVVAAWNAIKSATSAVFGWISDFVSARWNYLKNITSTVWNTIKTMITMHINNVKAVLNSIGGVISKVIGFFQRARSGASSALSSMRSAVSSAVSSIIGFFGRMVSSATGRISSLISTVRGIGGRIKSAVGNLGRLLVNAGRAVIQGLIDGIGQKLGALRAKASSAASTIRNLFPFSPAKEGPLSGSGSPDIAGAKIADMIATGLQKRIPAVRAAALTIADAAQPATGRGTGLDLYGRGILRQAFGQAPIPRTGGSNTAGGPPGAVLIGAGAIVLNFYGEPPTEQVAYKAGEAAGRGLAAAFQDRDVRTTVRTM